jgi:hypothetical protein
MKRRFPILILLLSIIALQCSLPSNVEKTAWRAQVTLPIGIMEYSAEELLGISEDKQDTLALMMLDTFAVKLERELFKLDSIHFDEKLGALKMQKSIPVVVSLGPHLNGQAYNAVPFYDTSDQTVQNIYHIVFDSSSRPLLIHMHNAYAEATLDSIVVWIADKGAIVTSGFLDSLPPGDSAILPVAVSGKSIDSIILIGVRATIRGNGAKFSAEEGLEVTFLLDGMTVSEATILDSLLILPYCYRDSFAISDTFSIDYMDFDTSKIEYKIRTSSSVNIAVTAEMVNLWDMSFCKKKCILNHSLIAENTVRSDSADPFSYRGGIIFSDTLGKSGSMETGGFFTLGPARLFPVWNSATHESECYLRFITVIMASGRRITINKKDFIKADVDLNSVSYGSLYGMFQYQMCDMGETISLTPLLPWKKSISDSLRHKLKLNSVKGLMEIRSNMSDSTRIDSALLNFRISDACSSSSFLASSSLTIHNLTKKSVQKTDIDLTNLINEFPDSLVFSYISLFPAGSRLFLTNEHDIFKSKNHDNFKLGIIINVSTHIPLDWEMADTAIVILEDSKIPMDSSLKDFNVMRDMEIGLTIRIGNMTNLSGVLYAIAAADSDGKILCGLREDQVDPEICDSEARGRFIDLLGKDGLTIPERCKAADAVVSIKASERDSSASVNIENVIMSPEQYIIIGPPKTERILKARELFIRWKLIIPKKRRDALIHGDKIVIASSFRVKGVMTTHTLLDPLQE